MPQWVLEEAAGKVVTPVPFRGSTAGTAPPGAGGRRGSHRLRRGGGILLVAALIGGAVYLNEPAATPLAPVAAPAVASPTSDFPPAGYEESADRLGPVPSVAVLAEGQGFRFSRHEDGTGAPVTWSPCRPIHYVTRPDNAPVGGEQMLNQAVADVGSATGLIFVNDGVTDEGPAEDRRHYQPDRYGNRWAPVLVAWATRTEVPDFGVDIAGEAGPTVMRTPSGDSTYISGVVYLDPVKIGEIVSAYGVAAGQSVIRHELGHLVGLAHVDDAAQLMAPRNGTVTDFGSGDRSGLAALGQGPCQPDV